MRIELDHSDLQPLIEATVARTVAELLAQPIASDKRLAYLEPEAAGLLGLQSHQLRDARLRGEITSTKAGGRIAYERSELLNYLARNRQD